MTQSFDQVPLAGPKSQTEVSTAINNAINSLLSSHIGPSRPDYAVKGAVWFQLAGNIINGFIFDGSVDHLVFTVDVAESNLKLNVPLAGPARPGLVEKATAEEMTAGVLDKYPDTELVKTYITGLGTVASDADGIDATSTDTFMTPLRTAQYIASIFATRDQARRGADATVLMTPAATKQAFDTFYAAILAGPAPDGLLSRSFTFTSSGIYTPTPEMLRIRVIARGSGGNGGDGSDGAAGSDQSLIGGNGGNGGHGGVGVYYVKTYERSELSATEAISIGTLVTFKQISLTTGMTGGDGTIGLQSGRAGSSGFHGQSGTGGFGVVPSNYENLTGAGNGGVGGLGGQGYRRGIARPSTAVGATGSPGKPGVVFIQEYT